MFKKIGVFVASGFASVSAFAAPPAEVTAALADMGSDGAAIAGIVLGAIATVVAIKFLKRAF